MESDTTLEIASSKIFRKSGVGNQVEFSTLSICDTIDDGYSVVSNVKVEGNNYEKKRREEDRSQKEQRLNYIEKEEQLAEAKFQEIDEEWKEIIKLQNPLEQYESTEIHLGNKCKELLADKDKVIRKLKEVLKKADLKLQKDLQRQTSDSTLLLSTISEQEKILKRAVLTQLTLIEETIQNAGKETKEEFHKIWQELDDEREEAQARFMSQKVKSVIDHYDEIANHEILLQEQDRSSRIRLDQDVQRIHRELQDLKAVCLLNIEKMDYNTHLLRKQAEESKLLKSQQDKTMLKIKTAVEDLKQITHSYRNNGFKIRKLRNNLDKLYSSIVTELDMRKFTDVHLKKFKQIWKFNKETADNLLQKILFMDRSIVERLFQLKWSIPENTYVKNLLMRDTKLNLMVFQNEFRMKQSSEPSRNRSSIETNEDILTHLLRIVVDSSGYLMEEKLFELLKTHSHSERLLVQLSNVFDVLGIRNENDVYKLYNHLEPYIECLLCQQQSNKHLEQNASHSQIIDVTLFDESSNDNPMHSLLARSKEDEALLYLDTMIDNRYYMIREVVREFTDSMAKSDDASVESWNFDTTQRFSSKSDYMQIKLKTKKNAVEIRTTCRDLNHPLTISTSNLMKALHNLVCKIDEKKCLQSPITLYDRLDNLPSSKYSHIGEKDIVNFWNGYKNIFTLENERQWDAVLIGLREYYDELKERHYLNTEVEKQRLDNLALEKILFKKSKRIENNKETKI